MTWGTPKWPPIPPDARQRPGEAGALLDRGRFDRTGLDPALVDPALVDSALVDGARLDLRVAMHEMGIVMEIVDVVSAASQGEKVGRIVLEFGKLSTVLPDAVRFCFDLATEGTPLEGAELAIVEIPGRAACRDCGGEVMLERPFGRCACGGTDLEWLAGEELKIQAVEVG